jgi:hypothetical protein
MGDPQPSSRDPTADNDSAPVLKKSVRSDARTAGEEVIPLVEEVATVTKREVVIGHVRV